MTHFLIKKLVRADYNPRIMPEDEMKSLMLSIETHGFVEPVVVNIRKERYGVIVGGHQRVTAIEKLLEKGVTVKGLLVNDDGSGVQVPIFAVDLDLEHEKQLNIALNKIHGNFDQDKLYALIFDMKGSETLESTGFSGDEIADILASGEEPKPGHKKGPCARCEELSQSVAGHNRRTGHEVTIEKIKHD